jgi:hypothetical protein
MAINTNFSNFNNTDLDPGTLPAVGYHEIIHHLNPVVIPRVTAIANMGWCERAAYDISFFGVQGFQKTIWAKLARLSIELL